MKRLQFYLFFLPALLLISGCATSPPDTLRTDIVQDESPKPHGEILRYGIEMPDPHTHYFEISITIPGTARNSIEFMMPAWSPGRYIIYDFAKQIKDVVAYSSSGKILEIERCDKQTWRISGAGGERITLAYKIYANYLTGTHSFLSPEGGLINGASLFLYPAEWKNTPIELNIRLPEDKTWSIATSLKRLGKSCFRADNYEHLIDCPISFGSIRSYRFRSLGKPVLVCFQSPQVFPVYEETLASNCKKLCDTAAAMFNGLPFPHYTFIFHSGYRPGEYDGMEHFSSSCMTDIKTISNEAILSEKTTLAAHELFHVWNVKGIKPREFISCDLSGEIHTRSLWIVEGLTRYYQYILQMRAGIITQEEFRNALAWNISVYESTPGRLVTTLEDSSVCTWLDRYSIEDTNMQNTKINYYNKGAIAGLLLDLKIRDLTLGKRGLDDVFRKMFDSFYKQGNGYSTENFYEICSAVAGYSLDDFFRTCAQSLDPLPYGECADAAGFIIENRETAPAAEPGFESRGNRIVNIIPGSNAEKAGFQKYDEIIMIDNAIFSHSDSLPVFRIGQKIAVTIERYGIRYTLPLIVGEKIPVNYIFAEKPDIDEKTAAIRKAFYAGKPE